MKLPKLQQGTLVELAYFDTWETQKVVVLLYYLVFGLLWMLGTFFTVETYLNLGVLGLLGGGLVSLVFVLAGVLVCRVCLECCLSVSLLRDQKIPENQRLVSDV